MKRHTHKILKLAYYQNYCTRHKLSIVMALSTTFTQYAPEITKFAKNKGHFAIQGHRFWYQLKAHIRLPISY